MNIVLTQQARFDLRRLRAFLTETDPKAAQRAADALTKAIRLSIFFRIAATHRSSQARAN